MAIEHRNIPESGLHEPKGISIAPSNRVYISNGGGSGEWLRVGANTLQGPISPADPAGRRVVTDGTGGFTTERTFGSAFGTMNLAGNSTVKSVTAASNPSLLSPSDFVEYDIALSFASLSNMGSGSNSLIIQGSGLYLVDFWANVQSNVNSTKFSLRFVKNGAEFVPRGPIEVLGSSGNLHNISANGIHQFSANDEIKLFIAADKSCNITIQDMTFQLIYARS